MAVAQARQQFSHLDHSYQDPQDSSRFYTSHNTLRSPPADADDHSYSCSGEDDNSGSTARKNKKGCKHKPIVDINNTYNMNLNRIDVEL
jgi:hypothetical protein